MMNNTIARDKYERALNYVRNTYSDLIMEYSDTCVSLYALKDGEYMLLVTICCIDFEVEENK